MKAGTKVIVAGLDPARGKVGTLVGRQPIRPFRLRSGLFEVELDEDRSHVFTSSVTRYRQRRQR